ncbi:hypothetical protein KCU62_g357, partial [Aureobasidium sp. EXF-3399]
MKKSPTIVSSHQDFQSSFLYAHQHSIQTAFMLLYSMKSQQHRSLVLQLVCFLLSMIHNLPPLTLPWPEAEPCWASGLSSSMPGSRCASTPVAWKAAMAFEGIWTKATLGTRRLCFFSRADRVSVNQSTTLWETQLGWGTGCPERLDPDRTQADGFAGHDSVQVLGGILEESVLTSDQISIQNDQASGILAIEN